MSNEELNIIVGGAWSGTLIKAVKDALSFVLDLGRKVGSAVRRLRTGNICK